MSLDPSITVLCYHGIILTIALETAIAVSIDTLHDDFIYDSRNQNFTDISVNPTTWTNLTSLRALSKTTECDFPKK